MPMVTNALADTSNYDMHDNVRPVYEMCFNYSRSELKKTALIKRN